MARCYSDEWYLQSPLPHRSQTSALGDETSAIRSLSDDLDLDFLVLLFFFCVCVFLLGEGMMLRYVCQFLTRKSWTLKLSIWKITAFRMNQLRFWCSLTTLVFNVGWAAQISGAGVIFGCLGSKNDWFEWISSICCDLTFFWWSFHRSLVICMLFGDWEGKVFQDWVPWNEIGGLGRSILHPDFRVELHSVWSIFFMLVPSGLVEKAGF